MTGVKGGMEVCWKDCRMEIVPSCLMKDGSSETENRMKTPALRQLDIQGNAFFESTESSYDKSGILWTKLMKH